MMQTQPLRLAIVVSHPIQYCVPLYRRLAARKDIELRVFFTWHAGERPQHDRGFGREVSWDIPLTEGYEYELVPNISRSPGTHHFWGIRNADLVRRVTDWGPDAVHITGYAFAAHLRAIRGLSRRGIPVLFRGDSHLLNDKRRGLRWVLKRFLLGHIYRDVRAFLYVGKHNYDYYRAFGVPESRLFYCPHSIDVDRFAEPNDELENKARRWREQLGIPEPTKVLLFAGKFEPVKRPIELMSAISRTESNAILLMVGNGELEQEVQKLAAKMPERFRVLPFQNQSVMPVVYRLGDLFVLPSASETWGLAVNEALASGRKVLLSNKVGCAPDVVRSTVEGQVFPWDNWRNFETILQRVLSERADAADLRLRARDFDISATEKTLCETLAKIAGNNMPKSKDGRQVGER